VKSDYQAEVQGYNGRMFIAWTDTEDNNFIKIKTWVSTTAITSAPVVSTKIKASNVPTLESYQGTLYMAYFDSKPSGAGSGAGGLGTPYPLYVRTLTQIGKDFGQWSAPVAIASYACYQPAFSIYDDTLFLFYIEDNAINYVTYIPSTQKWSPPTVVEADFKPTGISVASRLDVQYLLASDSGNNVYVKEFSKDKKDWRGLTDSSANVQSISAVGATIIPGVPGPSAGAQDDAVVPWRVYLAWRDMYPRESTAKPQDTEKILRECFLEVREK